MTTDTELDFECWTDDEGIPIHPSDVAYPVNYSHDLVMFILGEDCLFPRGYQVLIQLYAPPKIDEYGLERPEKDIKAEIRSTMTGRVLRFGEDAFQDTARFPSGPLVGLGEWGIFRGHERQHLRVNGIDVAFVTDDRFVGVTTAPEKVQTSFDPHHELTGV